MNFSTFKFAVVLIIAAVVIVVGILAVDEYDLLGVNHGIIDNQVDGLRFELESVDYDLLGKHDVPSGEIARFYYEGILISEIEVRKGFTYTITEDGCGENIDHSILLSEHGIYFCFDFNGI